LSRLDLRTVSLLVIPPMMWAGNAVVGRLMVGAMPPVAMNALRWVIVALLLLPLAWRVCLQPAAWLRRWPNPSQPTSIIQTGTLAPIRVTFRGVEVCSARYCKAL